MRSQRAEIRDSVKTQFSLQYENSAVLYIEKNIFRIIGTPQLNYTPGAIVYVPGGGWASILAADVGSDAHIYLSEPVCYYGMRSIALHESSTGFENLCMGSLGTPISGGNLSGWPASAAFDGVLHAGGTTCWVSAQSSTGVPGNAWLGYQFNVARSIRWFRVLQTDSITPADTCGYISSAIFQHSDDGSIWTDVGTYTLRPDLFHLVVTAVPAAAHAYWRLLANATPAAKWWGVTELQMGE